MSPARYFIVRPAPLTMTPGLFRLGHDFGNGSWDSLVFQRDDQAQIYRAEKQRILSAHPERLRLSDDDSARALQARAFEWISRQLGVRGAESPAWATGTCNSTSQQTVTKNTRSTREEPFHRCEWKDVSLQVQEDMALLQQDAEGHDRLVLLSVCFPSGWRPESLLGASFERVHRPVPAFEAVRSKRSQLVRAMVTRGPYVRFVWTVTADGRLDHHPLQAPREPWTEGATGFLRVERQVTVPFAEQQGSLFVIRTYLYPFAELAKQERDVLGRAVAALPADIAAYKGIDERARSRILACLAP